MKNKFLRCVSAFTAVISLFLFASCNQQEETEPLSTAYNLAFNTANVEEENVVSKTVEKSKTNCYLVSIVLTDKTYRYEVNISDKSVSELENESEKTISGEDYKNAYNLALSTAALEESSILKTEITSLSSSDSDVLEINLYTASSRYYFSYDATKKEITSSKVDQVDLTNTSYDDYISQALTYLNIPQENAKSTDIRSSIISGDKIYRVAVSTENCDYFVTINAVTGEITKYEAVNSADHIAGGDTVNVEANILNKLGITGGIRSKYFRSSFYSKDKVYEMSFDLDTNTYEIIVDSSSLEVLKFEKYDVNYYNFYRALNNMDKTDFGNPDAFDKFKDEFGREIPQFDLSKYYPSNINNDMDRNLIVAKVLAQLELTNDRTLNISINYYTDSDGSSYYYITGSNDHEYFEVTVDTSYDIVKSEVTSYDDLVEKICESLNVSLDKIGSYYIFKEKDRFLFFGKVDTSFIEAGINKSTGEVTVIREEQTDFSFITKDKAVMTALRRYLFAINQVTIENVTFTDEDGKYIYVVNYYDQYYNYTVEVDAVSGKVLAAYKNYHE